jgi:hypothetical protein
LKDVRCAGEDPGHQWTGRTAYEKRVEEKDQTWVVEEDNKGDNSMGVVYRKEEEDGGSSSEEVDGGSSGGVAAAEDGAALSTIDVVEDSFEETKSDYSVMSMGPERILLRKKCPHGVMSLHLADVLVQRYFD